jgi:hypothetical protein
MGIAKRNIGAVASKYNGERREFALGILLLCALAGTPLVWIKWLSFGGLSAGPFMLVLVVFSVFALLSGRRSTLRLYLSLNAGLIWSICLYVLYVTYVWGTLETFSLRDWLRPGLYAFFGFWVAVYVAGMSAVGPRTLALAAVAGAGGFLTAFGFAALNAGVDPIGTVLQSVRTGDTSLLMYTLFRSAMVAGAQESLEEVSANLRHGIGLGLVLCALTSLTFLSSVARRSLRLIIRSAVFLCLGFALLTLSRATLSVIALSLLQYAIAPLLFRHGAAKRRLGGIAVFFAFAGLFLIFNNLLVARIQETGSYSVRVEILSSSLKAIAENPIFPADRDSLGDAKGSSHVVAVDAWKYGGLLGGLKFPGFAAC